MKLNKLSLVLIASMLSLATASTVYAKKDLPNVNDEGMELVEDSKTTTIYVDPNADLGVYNRILLQDATVAFKKNWQRDQNRSNHFKVKDRDVEKIKTEVASLFREVFTAELRDGGYELVEEAGENVLSVVPAIVELDVTAPDVQGASRSYSFSESAGEMTLNLDLFDSLTNDKLASATDHKRDFQRGYNEWRTSVSNRSVARRLMTSWAKALREVLDDAMASTSASK